jgi:hypothetical protein
VKYRDRVPSFDEYKELANAFHNTKEDLLETFNRLDLEPESDFCKWYNHNGADNLEQDLQLYVNKYTKLGKLLQGVEDV